MKRKFIILCTVALLVIIKVNAQSGLQLRAGINLANVSVTDNGRVNKANTLTSFQVGVISDVHLASILYWQPGIVFTGKGSKTESGSESSATFTKATTNPYYIEVPATFVLKLPVATGSKFFIGVGPYAAIGVGGKNKVEGKIASVDYNSEKSIQFSNDNPTTLNTEEGAGFGIMKRFDYGLNGTAGLEAKSIVLGVNYGLGLAKLQSGTNNSAGENNKHRVFSITVGFKL